MRNWIFVLVLSGISVFAQKPVTLKIDKSVSSGETIELKVHYRGKTKLFKSIEAEPNSTITVTDFMDAGLYTIGLKGYKNDAEFIYNPEEDLVLEVNSDLANGSIAISQSNENTCYNDLIKINNLYNYYLDSLYSLKKNLSFTTRDFYGRCFFIDSVYNVVSREKNGRLTYLQFVYPATFTSKVLVPLNLIPVANDEERYEFQTPEAYLALNYFKYYQPTDQMLHHYATEDAIVNYLSKYSLPGMDGIKQSIDYINSAFSSDSVVKTYVTEFLVKTFLDAKSPDLALHAMGGSSEGCGIELGDKQAEYLSNYTHVKTGNIVDDIVLNDISSAPVSLSTTCKKYQVTFLIFWTSWCTHCKKFLPELKTILDAYKAKVGVFAVSLDENRQDWTEFVNTNGLSPWVHVSELKPVEKSTLAPRFMVTHTPTIFMLDAHRKIVAKYLTKDQIIAELKSRMK